MAASKKSGDFRPLSEAEKKKVKVAVENGDGSTLLHYLDTGWNVRQPLDRDSATALHLCSDPEIGRILCERGADVNARDSDDWTPLHYAAHRGKQSTVEWLTGLQQTSLDVRTNFGDTPLHLASFWGQTETVQLLITKGSDAGAVNKFGQTPLHLAAQKGQHDVIEVFIRHQVSLEVRDKDGDTLLHLASKYGRLAVVTFLLQKGVDARAENELGQTAYDVCGDGCNVFFNKVDDKTLDKIKEILQKHMQLKRQGGKQNLSDEGTDEDLAPVEEGVSTCKPGALQLLAGLEGYVKSNGEAIPDGAFKVSVTAKRRDDGTLELLSVDTKLMEYFPLIVPIKQSGLLGTIPYRGENVISAHLHESLTNAMSSVVLLARADAQGVGSGFRVGRNYVMTNYHVYALLSHGVPMRNNAALFHFNKSLMQCMDKVAAVPILSLVASDPVLDIAVLELDLNSPLTAAFNNCKAIDNTSLPPPLRKFKAIVQQEQLHFAGHPDGDQKVVEIHCRVVLMQPGEFRKTFSELRQWAQQKFPGFDAFPQIDDPRRVLYRTSSKFGKGSSGSPGFVPDDQQEACVAVIQTRGFPDLPVFHFVSQDEIKARSVEQGVRVEAVYDFLNTNHPALCQDIFGNIRPS